MYDAVVAGVVLKLNFLLALFVFEELFDVTELATDDVIESHREFLFVLGNLLLLLLLLLLLILLVSNGSFDAFDLFVLTDMML
jgi:hypothetical protein